MRKRSVIGASTLTRGGTWGTSRSSTRDVELAGRLATTRRDDGTRTLAVRDETTGETVVLVSADAKPQDVGKRVRVKEFVVARGNDGRVVVEAGAVERDDDEAEEDEDDGVLARDVRERASAEEVKTRCEENGLEVPRDLLDADGGTMRASTLDLYIKYSKYSVLAFLMNTFPAVRDRMLADPRFAFKLMVETGADVVMNTATEIKQRGDVFWDEFEFFACDQIAAFAVNTAILTICSPAIVLGNTTRSMRKLGELSKNANGAAKVWYVARKYVGKLPANVFMLDPKLGMMAKLARGGATVIARGGQIFFVSTLCGTLGQATANSLMMLRRAAGRDKYSKGYAESIDVSVDPPVLDTGLLWGRFMMFSANIRQQLVVGGERAVEQFTAGMPSASGRRLANGATVALRVFNNLKGGSDFNDFVIGQAIAEASRRDGGHA